MTSCPTPRARILTFWLALPWLNCRYGTIWGWWIRHFTKFKTPKYIIPTLECKFIRAGRKHQDRFKQAFGTRWKFTYLDHQKKSCYVVSIIDLLMIWTPILGHGSAKVSSFWCKWNRKRASGIIYISGWDISYKFFSRYRGLPFWIITRSRVQSCENMGAAILIYMT